MVVVVLAVVPTGAEAAGAGVNGPLAFSNGYGVFSMNPDGGGVEGYSPTPDSPRADWSPDGRRLAWLAYEQLCIATVGGSAPTRCYPASRGCGTPRWSPDGTRIVNHVKVYDAETGAAQPIPIDPGTCRDLEWSPDGTRLLSTASESGAVVVVVIDPATGVEHTFRPAAGEREIYRPRWAPDGRVSFLASHLRTVPDEPYRTSVVLAERDGSARTVHGPVDGFGQALEWTADTTRAYLMVGLGTLVALDLATNTTTTIAEAPASTDDQSTSAALVDLSPDERYALIEETTIRYHWGGSEFLPRKLVRVDLANGARSYLEPAAEHARGDLHGSSWGTAPHDLASASVPAGGTAETNPAATSDAPVRTAATSPQGGNVIIHTYEDHSGEPAQPGYAYAGHQVVIEAPEGSASQPLVLTFDIHRSAMPPSTTASDLQVFRNGDPIGPCTGSPGAAIPDPCVSRREVLGDGGARLVVLTSRASTWNFGVGCGGSGVVTKPVGKLIGKTPPPVRDPALELLCATEGTGL